MDTSILLARIIGPLFVAASLGILFNFQSYQKILDSFTQNPALLYISGFLALVLGLLLVNVHNLWVADWRVIITILAWISVIKGIMLLIKPGLALALGAKYQENRAIMVVQCCILLGLGVLLTVLGYLT